MHWTIGMVRKKDYLLDKKTSHFIINFSSVLFSGDDFDNLHGLVAYASVLMGISEVSVSIW